jgi:hypothetical protein
MELIAATPDSRVEFDARVRDRETGKLRQIDVAVWQPSSHGELLIAVECKDHKRRVGVAHVEAFKQKSAAVGASRAALVSRSGFTDGATAKAAAGDIDLLVVSEVASDKWPDWMAARAIGTKTLKWDIKAIILPPKVPIPLGGLTQARRHSSSRTGTWLTPTNS